VSSLRTPENTQSYIYNINSLCNYKLNVTHNTNLNNNASPKNRPGDRKVALKRLIINRGETDGGPNLGLGLNPLADHTATVLGPEESLIDQTRLDVFAEYRREVSFVFDWPFFFFVSVGIC